MCVCQFHHVSDSYKEFFCSRKLRSHPLPDTGLFLWKGSHCVLSPHLTEMQLPIMIPRHPGPLSPRSPHPACSCPQPALPSSWTLPSLYGADSSWSQVKHRCLCEAFPDHPKPSRPSLVSFFSPNTKPECGKRV